MRYICSICGYVYDEAENTPWSELPDDWRCPLCGAAKSDFVPEGISRSQPEAAPASNAEADMKPLSAIETSALCSNLAKGCEKQYKPQEAEAFRKLASWFKAQSGQASDPSFGQLLELINEDLTSGYPAADQVSKQNGDRGALRSLTWSGKVTRILKSLLERYAREGESMLENTGIYVCTICGFVYIGDDLPEVCPVCKVPNRKFERIGG
ncbi:MAG: rubredoxin [Clostridiales bacterium]|nr:rubredoxin [Clostridiales bacterium]